MSRAAEHLKQRLGNPGGLAGARTMAHAAVQVIAKAGRANLGIADDGSDMSLTWALDLQIFLTRPLEPDGEGIQLGLALDPLRLVCFRDGDPVAEFGLDGARVERAESWRDAQLAGFGLKPAGDVKILYDLPEAVVNTKRFDGAERGLAELAQWFSLAGHALQEVAAAYASVEPGPSPVRCWPHHFDIATFIAFEHGDTETARGIGVGLSPGDTSYDQPYFYVNPWPPLDAGKLPPPIVPGHWHVDGFVGSVVTGQELLQATDVQAAVARFLSESLEAGWHVLRAG